MNTSYRIGIAGYMGAGKSACARFLADAFAPDAEIIDADAEAKHLMQSDQAIIRVLADAFGVSIHNGNALDFAALGAAAFGSAHKLQLLNSIVHTKVIAYIEQRLASSDKKYCLCDAALIPLWNIENRFDMLLWISSRHSIRFTRLIAQGRLPEASLRKRMELQESIMKEPAELQWRSITNNGTYTSLAADELNPLIGEIKAALLK